ELQSRLRGCQQCKVFQEATLLKVAGENNLRGCNSSLDCRICQEVEELNICGNCILLHVFIEPGSHGFIVNDEKIEPPEEINLFLQHVLVTILESVDVHDEANAFH